MPEVCRVYNRYVDAIRVTIEPWATEYVVKNGSYLSIHADNIEELKVELEVPSAIDIVVYLNGCIFDDIGTTVKAITVIVQIAVGTTDAANERTLTYTPNGMLATL